MKVAVLTQNGFEIRDRAIPPVGPEEILVRTIACGICEGDVFTYRTTGESGISEIVLGHEGTGVVIAVGRNVRGFAEGDLVTAIGGSYAEYFVMSPDRLVKLPENIDPAFALGEPIACCVHAGNRFGVRPGDQVAVIGCGFMGLMCLQLARYHGAEFVCGIEPIAWRREVATQLGADAVLSPEGQGAEKALQAYGEFDVVVEATGVQDAIDMSGDLVKQHGRIIIVGYHQTNGGIRRVNMKQWNFKAVDVVNGHVRREKEKLEAMRIGIDLMSAGHLAIEPLVTCYDLPRVEEAFQDLVTRKESLFKAVLIAGTR